MCPKRPHTVSLQPRPAAARKQERLENQEKARASKKAEVEQRKKERAAAKKKRPPGVNNFGKKRFRLEVLPSKEPEHLPCDVYPPFFFGGI